MSLLCLSPRAALNQLGLAPGLNIAGIPRTVLNDPERGLFSCVVVLRSSAPHLPLEPLASRSPCPFSYVSDMLSRFHADPHVAPDEHTLVRDLWNKPIVAEGSGEPGTAVPFGALALRLWVASRVPRPLALSRGVIQGGRISVRVQGFLKSFDLSPIGTWSG